MGSAAATGPVHPKHAGAAAVPVEVTARRHALSHGQSLSWLPVRTGVTIDRFAERAQLGCHVAGGQLIGGVCIGQRQATVSFLILTLLGTLVILLPSTALTQDISPKSETP